MDSVQRAEFDAQLSWDKVAGHAEAGLDVGFLALGFQGADLKQTSPQPHNPTTTLKPPKTPKP